MTEVLLFNMLAKTGAEFSRTDSSCVTVSDFPGITVTVSDSLAMTVAVSELSAITRTVSNLPAMTHDEKIHPWW